MNFADRKTVQRKWLYTDVAPQSLLTEVIVRDCEYELLDGYDEEVNLELDNNLYETYENIIKQGSKDLLPIAHSTQNAHIEVTLNSNSEMIGAEFVDKDNASTLIPVTEASASRTSGNAPHPLCDKLQYLAGDYEQYTGKKKEFYDEYIKQLKDWCQSEHSNNKVKIIYNYLVKGAYFRRSLGIMIVDEKASNK